SPTSVFVERAPHPDPLPASGEREKEVLAAIVFDRPESDTCEERNFVLIDSMTKFLSLAELRAACQNLPRSDAHAAAAVAAREAQLTNPPGSLGRLETIVGWLAQWQGHAPRLDKVDVLVFAGNHGVVAQGVSAYPPEVTAQMVANFSAGGAAINQLAGFAGASLRVIPLTLPPPT